MDKNTQEIKQKTRVAISIRLSLSLLSSPFAASTASVITSWLSYLLPLQPLLYLWVLLSQLKQHEIKLEQNYF